MIYAFIAKYVWIFWQCLLSIFLWLNCFLTPEIMLWPNLNEDKKTLLWINEVVWVVEIFRKLFMNANEGIDAYQAAIDYIKSTFILDIVATLPQVASFLNPNFAFLKNIRIYMIWLLHYPAEVFIELRYRNKDKRYVKALVYAMATFCQI